MEVNTKRTIIFKTTHKVSPNEITVVIRSVGERTESTCRHLLSQQVPKDNIVVINESPFSEALVKTFQVGLERGLPWTLCIDADVLLRNGAVTALLLIAEKASYNTFEIQGNVLDKFFGGPKPAGTHLYRTSLIPKALDCVQDYRMSMRPEASVIKRMASLGFPWIQQEMVIGLHDYEQYYKDIYRKAFIHAYKHECCIPLLMSYWRRLATKEADYKLFLWGILAGQIFNGQVVLDRRAFPQVITSLLQLQGLKEKEELVLTAFSGTEIAHLIDTFKPPSEYWDYQRLRSASKVAAQAATS